MSDVKIARNGKVVLELTYAEVPESISIGTVLPTDHYWCAGMAGWEPVSSRQSWAPPAAPSGAPTQAAPASATSAARKVLKGRVLDFNVATSGGTISGDDGMRYGFAGAEWKSATSMPTAGTRVEFEVNQGSAIAIYAVAQAPVQSKIPLAAPAQASAGGYYRSSDDRFLAGICGGLAHKWGRPTFLVRLVFFLFFPFILWFVYIVLWLAWKERPTTSALPGAPVGAGRAPVSAAPKKGGCLKTGLIVFGALMLLGLLTSIIAGRGRSIDERDSDSLYQGALRAERIGDKDEAFRLLQRSAQLGNADAFLSLGMNASGAGWPGHDRVEAWKWLTLAEKYGNDKIRSMAKDIKETISEPDYWEAGPLTSAHRAEGERRAAAFVVTIPR